MFGKLSLLILNNIIDIINNFRENIRKTFIFFIYKNDFCFETHLTQILYHKFIEKNGQKIFSFSLLLVYV